MGHEENFIKLIRSKLQDSGKIRILDMGCGYGGLLRRLWKEGIVWRAYGCDYSHGMCANARILNCKAGASDDIEILEESYLDVSIPDESVDLVISMEALLHVGPAGQKIAIEEVKRVLRPGGWMIFSDIMEKEDVNSQESLTNAGFSKFEFTPFSANVGVHYGTVRKVL